MGGASISWPAFDFLCQPAIRVALIILRLRFHLFDAAVSLVISQLHLFYPFYPPKLLRSDSFQKEFRETILPYLQDAHCVHNITLIASVQCDTNVELNISPRILFSL